MYAKGIDINLRSATKCMLCRKYAVENSVYWKLWMVRD
jgi:hypothetical protein